MHMVEDAGAGDAAEVPAEVVALGLVDGGEGAEPLRGETMDLHRFVGFELAELAHVPERRDHQVAGRVRIFVQQHESPLAAVDDEPFLVRPLRGETEEAALLFVRSLDVFESPRSPELPGHGAGAYAARGGATQNQRL